MSSTILKHLRMPDEAWRRHANPWSVWTRFAAIPAMILAVWSRAWIGWWALIPVALVMVWLFWFNVRIFAPVANPRSWAAKGIYGERIWLQERERLAADHRAILGRLVVLGVAGMILLAWGLIQLEVWPTVFGAVVLILAQLWRIDRFSLLYEQLEDANPQHEESAVRHGVDPVVDPDSD